MRISHLQDNDIQAYLDRRRVSGSDLVMGDEAHEHLQRCVRCREELSLYEQLYGELSEAPEIKLPGNFAKKVTLSLPPLAAARTRARIKAWLSGLAAALTVLAVLAALNWSLLVASAATSLTTGYVTALTWFDSVMSMVSLPDFASLESLIDFTTLEVIERYIFADHGTVNLLMVAALGILLIASLDGLLPVRPHRQRTTL